MEQTQTISDSVTVENRERVFVDGITDVGKLEEESLTVYTGKGQIEIKGENLQVTELSVETGVFRAFGTVNSVLFSDKLPGRNGFFARLMR